MLVPMDLQIQTTISKLIITSVIHNDATFIDVTKSLETGQIETCIVKNYDVLEDFLRTTHVFCDKTGTLTKNILKFKDNDNQTFRKFEDVDHMNSVMIDNWNSVVKPGDKVYHLGDVFFGNKDKFKKLWPRLNGRKRLIVGNHDDIKFLSSGGFFQKVLMWRIFKEFNMVLTHVPIHNDNFRKVDFNVHGHIHEKDSPTEFHKCVCVEQINYTPVHVEHVRDTLKKRN